MGRSNDDVHALVIPVSDCRPSEVVRGTHAANDWPVVHDHALVCVSIYEYNEKGEVVEDAAAQPVRSRTRRDARRTHAHTHHLLRLYTVTHTYRAIVGRRERTVRSVWSTLIHINLSAFTVWSTSLLYTAHGSAHPFWRFTIYALEPLRCGKVVIGQPSVPPWLLPCIILCTRLYRTQSLRIHPTVAVNARRSATAVWHRRWQPHGARQLLHAVTRCLSQRGVRP